MAPEVFECFGHGHSGAGEELIHHAGNEERDARGHEGGFYHSRVAQDQPHKQDGPPGPAVSVAALLPKT
jgi:hypothetical protein